LDGGQIYEHISVQRKSGDTFFSLFSEKILVVFGSCPKVAFIT